MCSNKHADAGRAELARLGWEPEVALFSDAFDGPKQLGPVLDALGVGADDVVFVGDTAHDRRVRRRGRACRSASPGGTRGPSREPGDVVLRAPRRRAGPARRLTSAGGSQPSGALDQLGLVDAPRACSITSGLSGAAASSIDRGRCRLVGCGAVGGVVLDELVLLDDVGVVRRGRVVDGSAGAGSARGSVGSARGRRLGGRRRRPRPRVGASASGGGGSSAGAGRRRAAVRSRGAGRDAVPTRRPCSERERGGRAGRVAEASMPNSVAIWGTRLASLRTAASRASPGSAGMPVRARPGCARGSRPARRARWRSGPGRSRR